MFEMVKIALNDIYVGETTPTALKNEVSTYRKMNCKKETRVMVNKSVNDFYTRFLFKMDALPQDVAFPL